MAESAAPSRWTRLYEGAWLRIVPRDWRLLGAAAAAAAALTAVFVYLAAQGENYALPDRAHLRELQGTVRLIRVNRYDIEFRLDPWKNVFEYPAKARRFRHVAAALRKGGAAAILVDARTFADGAPSNTTIYALTMGDNEVRSFDDVARAFRADNQVFYWLIALFAPIALALGASSLYEYRRSRLG
jgi:hypothetical protein